MHLIVYRNGHFEEEKALYNKTTKSVIIKGDYYHDKIDYFIEGYVSALNEFGIYTDEVEEKEIYSDHFMYGVLEFYNDEADYEEED